MREEGGGRTRGLLRDRRAGRRAGSPREDSGVSKSGNADSPRVWHVGGARKIRVGRYPSDDQNPGCEADCLVPGQRLRQAKCNALPFRAFIRTLIPLALDGGPG